LAKAFEPYIKRKLAVEGLNYIAEKFGSPDDSGAESIIRFLEITDEDEKARVKRGAFERVHKLLELLRTK